MSDPRRAPPDPVDLDTLAVDADRLQERGDPRGEWLSLEVAVARGTAPPSVVDPWRRAAEARLTDGVADVTWRWGFLDTLVVREPDALSRVLQDPVASRVRRVQLERGDMPHALPDSLVESLLDLPLEALVLDGTISTEATEDLAAAGVPAVGLVWTAAADACTWSGVTELVVHGPPEPELAGRLWSGEAVPDLRRLTVTRWSATDSPLPLFGGSLLSRLEALQVPTRWLSALDDHVDRLQELALFHRPDLLVGPWDAARIATWFDRRNQYDEAARLYRRAVVLAPVSEVAE